MVFCAHRVVLTYTNCQVKLYPNVFVHFSFQLMKGTMGGPQCEALTRCIKEALPVPAAIDFIT